ncbi:hypothetical protein [Streptomyces sp. CRN 30]|uniref:hypothetical protein n=1 Tax=Streptomyces sp. CRN 30 TaxID=3075613 RepID=UPI002A8151CA|nr:hypothetical protein [Streptomyces sp. CRN 30]
MKPFDVLILVGIVAVGAALALRLGDGLPARAALAPAAGGGGAFVGTTRIRNRRSGKHA